MGHKTFKLSAVSTAMLASLMAGHASYANAEETVDETITVTGIRGSIMRAMDTKRESTGIVDAINAEDMGKFPDTNLAESLQRITGVSIDRTNGEGSKVTVRGFGPDFNVVTLNGRQMPAANLEATTAASTRSFDFANLASEGVSGVQIYKTSRAEYTTGGIGSVINLETHRPLNSPGFKLSVGAKGVMDQSLEGNTITPELSAIVSNSFFDDKVGISLVGSYQQRKSAYNSAVTGNGWYTIKGHDADWGTLPLDEYDDNGILVKEQVAVINRPTVDEVYSVPRNLSYEFNNVERERVNGQLTLQFRPVDSILATLDYTYAKNEVETNSTNISAWFNNAYDTTTPGNIVMTEGTDAVGSVVAPVIYTDLSGADAASGVASFGTYNENKSLGFNLEFTPNENLKLVLDIHSSEAEAGPADWRGSNNIIGLTQNDRIGATVDYSKDFPVLDIVYANGAEERDASRMMSAGTSFRNAYMKSEIDQYQLKGKYTFDDGLVHSIDFGIASMEAKNRSAFGNSQRDSTWGGYGIASKMDETSPDYDPDYQMQDSYDDDIFTLDTVPDKFSDIPGSDNPRMEKYIYKADFLEVIDQVEAIAIANDESLGDCGPKLCAPTSYSTDRRVVEKQQSAFVQANFVFDVIERPANLSVGVRYEETDVTSPAVVPNYTSVSWTGANEFSLAAAGEPINSAQSGSYDNVLPALDFDIEIIDDLILRTAIGKSITRPSYSDIQGGRTVDQLGRINGGTGSSGNPNLLPFESTNFDLSAEWYYDEGSYMSIGYYAKDVKNFIGNGSITDTPFDVVHPFSGPNAAEALAALNLSAEEAGPNAGDLRQYYLDQGWIDAVGKLTDPTDGYERASFVFTAPSNAKEASIDGFEVAIQHLFGDSGFGTQINFTTVDGDVVYDNYNTNKGNQVDENGVELVDEEGNSIPVENQFVLLGLSDSANFVGFYEKDGLQVRLAYNWRDKFLVNTFTGDQKNPIYTEAYGQWDLNVSYDVNENLTVFVEGINITDEYTRQHSRHQNMVMNVTQQAPRYNIGARYTF
ncbi:TonB-dependent receptor [Catenovulum sp. SX2]|uniref:TonB-dependent receptor n=1 Tax=Catenovulum sp. SX2 TaxID=3398614 RepID=UPI003F8519D9